MSPINPILNHPREIQNKDLYANVHKSFICKSQKFRTNKMSVIWELINCSTVAQWTATQQ